MISLHDNTQFCVEKQSYITNNRKLQKWQCLIKKQIVKKKQC